MLATPVAGQEKTPRQIFANALRTDDLNVLHDLLVAGFNPNAPDALGQTPLYLAVLSGHPRFVQLLLAWHADPNAPLSRTRSGRLSDTPLQFAAREGNLQFAYALITAGARLGDGGESGQTPLHCATDASHLEMMRLLIDHGADVNARDSEGASPLDDAVWRGNLDAAAILTANGAHINDPDAKTGATPINEAAFRGNARLVRYLLTLHPDLATADKNGYVPITNAIRMTDQTSALLLLAAAPQAQTTPAFLAHAMDAAIRKNEARVIEALVDRGVSVNGVLPSGLIPLDSAASAGAAKAAGALLDRGADPNRASPNGATPLEDAALKGFDDMTKLLLERGALADHVNTDSGTTALYAAAAFGHAEAVHTLLEHGANPNLCGSGSRTPLAAAAQNGDPLAAAEIRNRGGRMTCAP